MSRLFEPQKFLIQKQLFFSPINITSQGRIVYVVAVVEGGQIGGNTVVEVPVGRRACEFH